MMGWADFGKFTYSGPAIAICLAVTLLAALTFVPALLATRLGVNVSLKPAESKQVFWHRACDLVLDKPLAILGISLALMLPLAWRGTTVEVTYDLLGELPSDRISRRGTELLRENFPPGEIGPLGVLVELPTAKFVDLQGQYLVARLSEPLEKDRMPGVSRIRSWYQPQGDPPGSVRIIDGWDELAIKGSPLAKTAFVSEIGEYKDRVTRLDLILQDEPFSDKAVATCERVEQKLFRLCADKSSPWYRAKFELLGPTAGIRDLQRVTSADRQRIQILVTVAVLLVILILLRRPLVCLYLIITVVFSYAVTLGAADCIFSMVRGDGYLGLDWKVPLFLFVILVAVGQDYNIYLVTRVIEEQGRLGKRAGLRQALVQTGGIITSCGIIMAGTFVSMLTAEMNGMVELGFALTLGILLDTFVVRTLLVPAFLALRIPSH